MLKPTTEPLVDRLAEALSVQLKYRVPFGERGKARALLDEYERGKGEPTIQPMSTAPRDGTPVRIVVDARAFDENDPEFWRLDGTGNTIPFDTIHGWLPLPADGDEK